MNWLKQKLTDVIGLDPRSLAVLRVGLGLTLLLDLGVRAMDVQAMYSGEGIVPIETSIKEAGPWGWSLHWISGELGFQWLLIGVALMLALGVVVGWRTTWMLLGSFVLLASIQTRNQAILNGGDGMFRVMLFWAIFLPLGRVWSLDARRRQRQGNPPSLSPVVSVATFCFMLQLCLVYWFAGTAKLNPIWLGFDPAALWHDPSLVASASFGGEALQHAMNYDIYTKPAAGLLVQMPWLLRLVCVGTLLLEIVGPSLLFVPCGTRWIRLVLIASFAMMHIGIELTLHVGMFSWVSLAAWAALLPPMFWESRVFQRRKRWAVNPPAVGKPSLLRQNPAWDWTKFIAGQAVPATLCAALMIVNLVWNCSYMYSHRASDGIDGVSPRERIQKPIRPYVNASMLRQRWNMFSQTVPTESWLIFQAELANGEVVDVFKSGQPATLEKPADLSAAYTNHRWRKLNVLLCSKEWRWRKHREPTAEYLCRVWNQTHGPEEQIVRCCLYQVTETKDDPDTCTCALCLTVVPEPLFSESPREDGAQTSDSEIATTAR